jgi:hypothetical protein
MPVYVDSLVEYGPAFYRGADAAQTGRVGARNGHQWCHLYADTEAELHAFAVRIGMKRAWAQVSRRGTPHYDLTPGRRAAAVKAGAVELDRHAACALRARLREGRAA